VIVGYHPSTREVSIRKKDIIPAVPVLVWERTRPESYIMQIATRSNSSIASHQTSAENEQRFGISKLSTSVRFLRKRWGLSPIIFITCKK
jgi:hypothetical protein